MIIGVLGNKNTGKDTVSDYLVERYNFIKKPLADPLKKACQDIFLLSNDQLYDDKLKELPDERWSNISPRQIFQFVGTDLFRNQINQLIPNVGDNIFLYHFQLWFEEEKKTNHNLCVVISDVRFQNEVNFIKRLGGYIVKLKRQTNLIDSHISETEINNINNFDYLIENNGTVTTLYEKIDNCLTDIFIK